MFSSCFSIRCDSSKLGVVFQKNDDGIEVSIAYLSQKLNKAQSDWSVTEFECREAILSLKKFRAYVEGQDFTILTDHARLQQLIHKTDLATQLARLLGYGFNIENRKGSMNIVPDTLSRQNRKEITELEVHPLVDVESSEFQSKEYRKLLSHIQHNQNHQPDI